MVSFKEAFKLARAKGLSTFKFNGRTYTTKYREEVEVPITLGVNGKTKGNTSREYIVNAPRTKITSNKNTLFQLVPFGERLWKDYVTGQIYVTDNYGNIIGSTMSEEAAKENRFLHYNGSLKLDAKRQAHITSASDLLNKASSRVGNPKLTAKLLQTDISNARGRFANAVNGIANTPNHIIAGATRAIVSPNYSWSDYKNGIVNPDITQLTIGVGDIAEIQNPYLRTALNVINPTSVGISFGLSLIGGSMKFKGKNLLSGKVKVPNTKNSGFYEGVRKGRSHNNPVKLSKAGWLSDNKPVSVFGHNAGTGSHIESIPRGTIIVEKTPTNISATPTFYYRTNLLPVEIPSEYIIDKGRVESPYVSPWLRKWVETGEMPTGGGTYIGNAVREGVFNTDNTYWKGLNGEGKIYNSNLMNTTNNGLGFTTIRKAER